MQKGVNRSYLNRITAFPEAMRAGNISVRLHNVTLLDNQRVFRAYASNDGRMSEICQITLHVAGKDGDFLVV